MNGYFKEGLFTKRFRPFGLYALNFSASSALSAVNRVEVLANNPKGYEDRNSGGFRRLAIRF
jgi:hypothetical protein